MKLAPHTAQGEVCWVWHELAVWETSELSGAEGAIGHAVVKRVAEDKVGLAWSLTLY